MRGNIPSGAALGSPLVKFHFIHCPHCALDVLHTHETFVKGQVVADGILNRTIHKTVSTKQSIITKSTNNENKKWIIPGSMGQPKAAANQCYWPKINICNGYTGYSAIKLIFQNVTHCHAVDS